jgi:NDP-4-keto-2,6-dideoxyhexose 3-C-methyltransferase
MSTSLGEFVKSSLGKINLVAGDVILDIGGNDGTLLSNFVGQKFTLVNVDIASAIEQVIDAEEYIYVNEKFSAKVYENLNLPAPKCLFSSAVFYQIPELELFCTDILRIMNSESIFFLQMAYLGSMYKNGVYDNIVHEHLTYFSLFSLTSLLERFGLQVIDAEVIDLYGGSLRVSVTKSNSVYPINSENILKIQVLEQKESTNELETLLKFGEEFSKWREDAKRIFSELLTEYGEVLGMGASTKGNMILQALGINQEVMPFILDNNKKKIGTSTAGSQIPILDEAEFEPKNSAVMLLPYYYLDFLTEKLCRIIPSGVCVKLFVPLPILRVIELRGKLE